MFSIPVSQWGGRAIPDSHSRPVKMTHTYRRSGCKMTVRLCCKKCTASAGKRLLSKDIQHAQRS